MDTGNRTAVHGVLNLRFSVALRVVNFREAIRGHAENFRSFHHTGLTARALVLVYIRDAILFFSVWHKTLFLEPSGQG